MQVQQLIASLNEMIESGELDEASEITVAFQPNYPLQASVANVTIDGSGQAVVAANADEWYGSKAYWDESEGWV